MTSSRPTPLPPPKNDTKIGNTLGELAERITQTLAEIRGAEDALLNEVDEIRAVKELTNESLSKQSG